MKLERSWRDPRSRRGALVRLVLFVPLFRALEYLLFLAFAAMGGGRLEGGAAFLSSGATLVAALLAGAAMIIPVDRRTFGALGFAWTRQVPREVGLGFALGGAGIVAAVAFGIVLGTVSYVADSGTVGSWVRTLLFDAFVFAIAAAAEEAVFRGYGFQVLARSFGPVAATLGTSLLFALAHAGNPNVTQFALLNIFLAGVLLCIAYLRTMSLWFATAVHLGWNWMMASAFDLPVSGLSMFQTPLYEPVTRGAAWVSGGRFGPEGGIAGTIGLLICLFALWRWVRIGVSPAMADLQPIALRAPLEKQLHE